MRIQKVEDINATWSSVKPGAWGKNMHKGEREMLYNILDDDETLKSIIGGTFRADTDRLHKHSGVAAATTKRVIFLDKGILGSTEVQEISYRSIEAITYSTGLLMAGVQITGRGTASFRIEDIPQKDSVKPFVDCVRSYMDSAAVPSSPALPQPQSAVSVADEIEKFGKLLESGILTQEEFDTKKRQLLGL